MKLIYQLILSTGLIAATITAAAQQVTTTQPSTTVTTDVQNNGTQLTAPAFENVPVYRLQLRLTTGRSNDAGTDDPVFVQMTAANDSFYLVKGKDNFVQGSTETYDVLFKKIKKVKDIDFIRLSVAGDDGVCIKKLELLLNNEPTPIFSKEYPGLTGICVDKGSSSLPASFTVTKNELRSHAGWRYTPANMNCWKPPVKMNKEWLVSLVEATVGNQIYHDGGKIKWGTVGGTLENRTLWGDAVEMTRVNDNTVHFDLDLELDRAGPNPEVDVDFDMVLFCNKGRIKTQLANVEIGTDDIGKALDFLSFAPAIGKLVISAVATASKKLLAVPYLARTVAFDFPAGALGLLESVMDFDVNLDLQNPTLQQGCTQVKVTANGDIKLQ